LTGQTRIGGKLLPLLRVRCASLGANDKKPPPRYGSSSTPAPSLPDVAVVACDPCGSIDFGICTWTPQFPSIPQATGTDDLTYHGSISIIWNVTWTSSTGDSGNLKPMTTTTPLKITVMEIQTIGGG
jgi:hypothetical protein